jgi:hypothetical protein
MKRAANDSPVSFMLYELIAVKKNYSIYLLVSTTKYEPTLLR